MNYQTVRHFKCEQRPLHVADNYFILYPIPCLH